MKHIKLNLLLIPLFLLSCVAVASHQVFVVALTQDKAVIDIDGKYHTLSIGQTSPEGVMLITADSETATLKIDGETNIYELGGQISPSPEIANQLPIIRLTKNSQGLYTVAGYINGYPVDFIVDTGASSIAISSMQADRMDIHYQQEGLKIEVVTASNKIPAYLINLEKVKVGYIVLQGIEAVVIEGQYPTNILLGMSFLDKIEMHRENESLELRQSN